MRAPDLRPPGGTREFAAALLLGAAVGTAAAFLLPGPSSKSRPASRAGDLRALGQELVRAAREQLLGPQGKGGGSFGYAIRGLRRLRGEGPEESHRRRGP